jgi:hypothetical protein
MAKKQAVEISTAYLLIQIYEVRAFVDGCRLLRQMKREAQPF